MKELRRGSAWEGGYATYFEVPFFTLFPPFRGFNSMKNEFLFEKRLTEHLPPIIAEFCNGKPTLVFCR